MEKLVWRIKDNAAYATFRDYQFKIARAGKHPVRHEVFLSFNLGFWEPRGKFNSRPEAIRYVMTFIELVSKGIRTNAF